jgi:trans-aconitate methyltransferase
VDLSSKYDALAEQFAETEYADPAYYNARRARAAFAVGPPVARGATVLDLGCGDASLAEEVIARGYRYHGVEASPEMVEAARRRLGGRGTVELGDFTTYRPSEPVGAAILLRVLYLVEDRVELLRRIGEYVETKIVFDAAASQVPLGRLDEEARRAGFDRFEMRPFLASMRYAPPRPVDLALRALERSGPLARMIVARRFRVVCAVYRTL